MPSSGNPTWQDSPSTTTPINAAHLQAIEAALTASEATANKGTAGGYAPLDGTGKVPSANLPTSTGGAAALAPTAVKTANYTAAVSDFVPVDTTSGSVTITLPTAPADKAQIGVKQVTRGGTNTVTITCGGSDVFNKAGGSTSTTLTLVDQNKLFQYSSGAGVWYITDDSLTLAQLDLRFDPIGAATLALSTKTANYTMTTSDGVIVGNGTSITVTLPSAVTAGATGKTYIVKNRNASSLTLASAAGTIDGATTQTLAQNVSFTVVSDGTNWLVV